ncbi:MAG: hypothetical protein ACOC8K_04825 [Gemmatimonadota bacterium]
MPIHDAYARVTPFERAFPDASTAEDRMDRIRRDLEEEGMEDALGDPGRFLTLPAVAEVVHGIRDPESGGEEVQKHGIFLYHAYHFHEAGRPVHFLTTGAARYLVETAASDAAPEPPEREPADSADGDDAERDDAGPDVSIRPPEPAGYLQLPRQLFWVAPGEDATPEPVDGFFWASPAGERLSLLLIGGMREDRPGFSVVPLPPVPLSDARSWIRASIRESGPDFETTLPGGDLERLYSFETTSEVLKLVARAFRYEQRHPEAVTPEEAPKGGAEGDGGGGADAAPESLSKAGAGDGPRPTRLPYRRIHLRDRLQDALDDPSEDSSEDPSEEGDGDRG